MNIKYRFEKFKNGEYMKINKSILRNIYFSGSRIDFILENSPSKVENILTLYPLIWQKTTE